MLRNRARAGVSIAKLILLLALAITPATAWVWNLVQLVSCDWDAGKSWKGEIIHGIGLIPYAGIVTVWFGDK